MANVSQMGGGGGCYEKSFRFCADRRRSARPPKTRVDNNGGGHRDSGKCDPGHGYGPRVYVARGRKRDRCRETPKNGTAKNNAAPVRIVTFNTAKQMRFLDGGLGRGAGVRRRRRRFRRLYGDKR